jgi:fumarate hydratase class I
MRLCVKKHNRQLNRRVEGMKGDKGKISDLAVRLAEFIRLTSSSLPEDAERALKRALRREKILKCQTASPAATVLETILANVALARKNGTPVCQDTGTLTFFVDESLRKKVTPEVLGQAVQLATEKGWLRRNTIDSISGKSIDTNVCPGAPVVHYVNGFNGVKGLKGAQGQIALLMKGGGSENMSCQFSLPDASLGAGRDLEGVRRAVLAAVQKAQGFGCAPGILGVAIGGDRASGFEEAKLQLLRNLDDTNADPQLARLERRILREANTLGIGPMGLGGKTTLLAVKIGSRPRVPASFFVTVAYLCWAARRRTLTL